MLCNPTSYYPDKIDEMIFFQDSSLEKTEVIKHHADLIAQGQYTEANTYINQQEGVYGFFADFLNLIENRIYSLQEYLLQKLPKIQPFLYHNEQVRFPLKELRVFSDTDEEEDISSVSMFSENEEQEIIDELYTFTEEEAEPSVVNKDTVWI